MGHMRDYGREAVRMIEGKTRNDLDNDRKLELALTRLVEIVGEAAGRVSDEGRAKIPAIPWKDIAGMRNRLAHGYADINLDVLWQVIVSDLPPMILELEKALTES